MPDIHRVKAVDIFRRIERGDHVARIVAARQRQLYQDAVDPVVGVESGYQLKDRGDTGIRRQAEFERGDPSGGAGARLAANIELARGIVADQDRGETGGDLMAFAQHRGRFGGTLLQPGGDRLAVDDCRLGHHLPSRRQIRIYRVA